MTADELLVGLDEMKEYLHVLHSHEDELIECLLQQAQVAAEAFCRTEFARETVPEPVRQAVMLHTGYWYAKRSNPDESGYKAMRRAFCDLLSPWEDPGKMF